MNAGRDFERLIADWLIEEAVPRAPDRVLDGARRVIDETRQRRTPGPGWLRPQLGPAWRLSASAAAVIVLIGAITLVALGNLSHDKVSNSPSPSAQGSVAPSASAGRSSPTAPGTGSIFNSSKFRYSITLPAIFHYVPNSTAQWPVGTGPGAPSNQDVDHFEGSGGKTFFATSWPMPKGLTAEAWLANYVSSNKNTGIQPGCFTTPAQMERTSIDGQPAWIQGGNSPCKFTEAIVFEGGRVYKFMGWETQGFPRSIFGELLSSVQLNP